MGETRKHLIWCVLALCGAAACGGDDDSSGIVTGLPAEQKLSTLTDADVKKACESVNVGANAVITPNALARAFCVPLGVEAAVTYSNGAASVDLNKCQQVVDTCVSSSSEAEDDEVVEADEEDVNDCEQSNANDLKSCEATVGEYEACVNMVLSELQRRLNELTCQNAEKLSSEEYSNDELDPSQIPQCQTIMTKCPDTSLGIPFAD
jgi:hypothetical protein